MGLEVHKSMCLQCTENLVLSDYEAGKMVAGACRQQTAELWRCTLKQKFELVYSSKCSIEIIVA